MIDLTKTCIKLSRETTEEDFDRMIETLKKEGKKIGCSFKFSDIEDRDCFYVRYPNNNLEENVSNYEDRDDLKTITIKEYLKENPIDFGDRIFKALAWLREDESRVIKYEDTRKFYFGRFKKGVLQSKSIEEDSEWLFDEPDYDDFFDFKNIKEYIAEEKEETIKKEVQKAIDELNKKFGREVCGLIQGVKINNKEQK